MHDILIGNSQVFFFLFSLILNSEVVEKYLVQIIKRFLQYNFQSLPGGYIISFQLQLIPMVRLKKFPELFKSIATHRKANVSLVCF